MLSQFAQRIIRLIAHKQLEKLQNSYINEHNRRLPVVVVVGTVGKSSVTLLVNDLLHRNGYKVISGTSEQKNLNTMTGLVMSLGGFYFELSEGNKFINTIRLITKGLWTIFRPKIDLSKLTALVSEIGFDYQNEAFDYVSIFGQIDLLIVTATTWEHNQGFEDHVNPYRLDKIANYLPESWNQALVSKFNDGKLRNIAIEQLWLSQNAHYLVLPDKIGEISNTILTNCISSEQTMSTTQNSTVLKTSETQPKFYTAFADAHRVNGILVSNKLVYNSKYLLPKSFARTSLILDSVVNALDLDVETVSQTVANCNLPFGRFGFFNGINDTKIVDSTYNSDPASLSYFLDTLEEVINNKEDFGNPSGHILILGEMRELGSTAVIEHRNVLDRILELEKKYPEQIMDIYLLGTEWQKCTDAESMEYEVKFKNRTFIRYLNAQNIATAIDRTIINKDSWFWIKGSQNTIFLEIVVEHLLQNQSDKKFLCRQEPKWDEIKKEL